MSCLGNAIWLIFGGFFAGIGYIIGGLLLSLTIIGIPLGKEAIKFGIATMAPFGKKIVPNDKAGEPLSVIGNIVWLIFFGWEIALNHLIFGLLFAITIVGLPFAKQHFKLIPLSLTPFGKDLVDGSTNQAVA